MTVNVGLVGCGSVANLHLHGYLELPDRARVVAVADVVAENAQRRAEQVGGAAIFSDYREMVATPALHAVDICLPHHLHSDAIVTAAEAGKHILCEKPLCITMEEADKVTRAVRDSGVTLMCAHNQLFMPPVARARKLIQEGVLGKVYGLRTTDSFYNRWLRGDMGWRGNLASAGGGELLDTGYHPTYLLLHLAAAKPVEVVAMTSRHRFDMEAEDSAQVLVRFADDSVGSIVTSWAYTPSPNTEKFSVVAEHGTLWSDGKTLSHRAMNGEATTIEFPEMQVFDAEIADFVECVEEGRRPIDTEEEGVQVLKLILAAYASADAKRIVGLADL